MVLLHRHKPPTNQHHHIIDVNRTLISDFMRWLFEFLFGRLTQRSVNLEAAIGDLLVEFVGLAEVGASLEDILAEPVVEEVVGVLIAVVEDGEGVVEGGGFLVQEGQGEHVLVEQLRVLGLD